MLPVFPTPGLDVLVLERSSVVGGAAVTSEIVPGFKFSRASYLAGLLRPSIIRDLELEKVYILGNNVVQTTSRKMHSPFKDDPI